MSCSVQYMATTPRVEFSADLAEAVVAAATILLTSERRSSFRAENLSVGVVWARRDNNSAFGQMRRAPALALVKALRLAHDDAPYPVLWPTPQEALEGRRATKQRRGGSSRDRGDRNRGGGISGGGGGQSGGSGENGGGVGHHNRRGGGNGGANAGGASGTGGGPQRRQGSNQDRTNRSGGRSSGGGTGGRRISAREPSALDGSSTSSRSSSGSNTDHGEVTVVAGKRQVTPSLVEIASSAERLSKLTVSGERTKPVSSDLALERTAELATAAALAKSTLDDSVRRAYVKLSYKDVSRISVLPFPASLNKSDGTQQLTRSVRSAMTDILMRCDDRCQEGVRAPTWVPGWIRPLRLAFNRAITPDRPTTARTTTLIDDFFGQVSRALDGGASGPEAFTLLLRLLVAQFDLINTGEGYTKLHTFGVCNGTPFSDFNREFRVLASAVTGGERVLSPGTYVVLEVVRMAADEQFPTLMPTLYPGSKAMDPRPYASLDVMWKAFSGLAHNKTLTVNGRKHFSLPVSLTGTRSSAPSGTRPAVHRSGQGRVPSQSPSWQTGSSDNPIFMSSTDSTDPWRGKMSNCWPSEEQHYAEGFAVSASFKTDDPPFWRGLLTPSARAAALRENRGHCLNCHEDTHSLRNCRHPFINASGCLNPELGQLGDDDVVRRWQARMVSYRRDGRSSRSQTNNKNCRNRSNQSRGYHQDQGQTNSHSGNHNSTYTPGQHGAVPPSPASSASASALGKRFGATHNLSGNPNARQPGAFRTGN